MKSNKLLLVCCSIGLLAASCSSSKKAGHSGDTPSLKEVFKKDFVMGTAVNTGQIEEKDPAAAALIEAQFNGLTPENIMKCEIIHPEWDRYDFTLADKLVDYGKKINAPVYGHTLIWHSQLSPFIRKIQSTDSFRTFFTNHITTIAARYDGKLKSWDVVNEALNEDGTLRKSVFLEKLGEDYIVEAFRLAQKAAPNTELYYNDYNIEQPKKRAGAIAIIKKIQAAGVRIDGVGIQGHWRSYKVPMKDIEESIKEFAALGIKVHFTELDLGVLPNPWDNDAADVNMKAEYSAKMNPYAAGLPDSVSTQLAQSYADLFRLFLKYKKEIARITFWGVNDGQSWLNGWPIRGRTNYPLLFDRNNKPKDAFYKVIETKAKPVKEKKSF
ncbi:MAG TPA: endo-1,4-beta-xylanase [Chitinophagaceae bacterium]|nr:endo-1,4-beta-xylanase [Chitinophagaceae bacterium]